MSAVDTTRADWLAWRQGGIGASDVAAILGLSPWASPWSVWADKAGLLPPLPDDEVMAAGRWLEAAIGPWFTHETGLHVAGEQTWCTHPEHEHHRCTVDGFVFEAPRGVLSIPHVLTDAEIAEVKRRWQEIAASTRTPQIVPPMGSGDPLGLLEVKVTGPGRRWDELPPHYQAQGQWQMHVTDLPRVWFAVLMGRRLDVHELARDQDDIDFMVEQVDRFWHDHVETGKPPAVDGSDATLRALAAVYPTEQPGETAEVHPADIGAWGEAKRRKAEATRDEKAAKAELLAHLGTAEVGTVDGAAVVTARSQTRTTTCKACGHAEESEPFRVLRPVKSKETR
jgi:putative phage-type endonuclease